MDVIVERPGGVGCPQGAGDRVRGVSDELGARVAHVAVAGSRSSVHLL